MVESNRLCLVLERVAEEVHEPELIATLPVVGFDAFVAGHRVFGWVRLDADRLTDMLNDHAEMELRNVLIERLEDGVTVTADEAIVRRNELIAVRASGPRGNAARWHDTVGHPTLVDAGPYRIGGYLHATPGEDPTGRLSEPDTMIPLTDAWIAYQSGGEAWSRRVGTIIVNRDLVTRIESVGEEDLAAELPVDPARATAA